MLVIASFGYMEFLAINNWMAGRWYLADVGSIQAALQNTLRGKFMWSPFVEANHYRYHFTPLLTALAPITLLSIYPIPLVTVYMAALALCPLPLLRIAREAGLHGALGVAMGVLFLGNHFTGSVELAYHFESIYILLMLCTIAFAANGCGWAFWLSAVGTLMVKEDASVWCGCFAVYCMFSRDALERDRGRRLLAVAACMLAVGVGIIYFVGRGSSSNASFYVERAGHLEFSAAALWSVVLLIASAGGLPVFGGRSLVLALVPGVMLLSSYEFTRDLLYYYSYPFLPFLFFATIHGAARVSRWFSSRGRGGVYFSYGLAALLCGVGVVELFLPARTDGYVRLPVEITARDEYRLKVARDVLPPNAPTAIQFGLWGVTPKRDEAWQLTKKNITAERWVFADLKSPYGMGRDEYVGLMRDLMDEVTSGSRKLLHSREDIYVVGPRIDGGKMKQ